MKLRNKIATITVAAMLAFVGVGFAAWHFTNTVNDSTVVDGRVTAAIEAHELRVTDGADNDVNSLYLICDAPEAGGANLEPGNGIYWSTNADGVDGSGNKLAITELTLIGSVSVDAANDIQDITSYTGTFTSTATAAHAGTYVNIAATTALDQDVDSVGKDDDVEYVWTLPAVSYASVPANVAQVEALQAEVNAISLTFAFGFSVTAIA